MLLVLLAVLVGCSGEPGTDTIIGPEIPQNTDNSGVKVLVRDSFSRTVSSGWGKAELGGGWHIDSRELHYFRVNGSQGLIVTPDSRSRNAVAREGYGVDVVGLVSISIDTPPDHPYRFHSIHVYARRNDRLSDGDNYYRYRVRTFGNGTMDVRIEKNVGGRRTWLTDAQRLSTTWAPEKKFWIRWECIGTSPTTDLRMRVWADGEAEPGEWHLDLAVDEPALDRSGTTGLRASAPNTDQVTFPIMFAFDDLKYGEASTAANEHPVAVIGGPYTGTTGNPISFDGTQSTDPDGDDPLSYAWDFGDGSKGTGATPAHTYGTAGSYVVTLIVTDVRGASSTPVTTTVTVTAPSTSTVASDSFSRTVSSGWGKAELGGGWHIDLRELSYFRVNGSQGLIVTPDSRSRNAVAREGYGVDGVGLVSISIDTPPAPPSRSG